MKKYLFITALIMLYPALVHAQRLEVLAGMSEKNTVIVRWFSEEDFSQEGVNLYRKDASGGTWTKLNGDVIKKMPKAADTETDSETLLSSFLIYNKPTDPDEYENWNFMRLSRCILDSRFARAAGVEYEDHSAEANHTYEYKVMILENGKETEGGISPKVKIAIFKPQPAPPAFTALEGDSKISFKWEHNDKNYFAYYVYRGESADGERKQVSASPVVIFEFTDSKGKSNRADTYFTDTTAVNGKAYYYTLAGIDYLGRVSAMTAPLKAQSRDLTPPPAPVMTKAELRGKDIVLKWHLNNIKNVKEINIFRCASSEKTFTKINTVPLSAADTSYTDKEVIPQGYIYYAESVNASGIAARSNNRTLNVPDKMPPAVPTGLRAEGDTASVSLTWKKGSDKDILGYYVYRSVNNMEDSYLLLTVKPIKDTIYIDKKGREQTDKLYYKIKAVDNSYNESGYSLACVGSVKDMVPPAAPLISGVECSGGIVNISWMENMERDIKGYDIYRSEKDTMRWTKLNKLAISHSLKTYADTLSKAGRYNYCMTSCDSAGNNSKKTKYYTVFNILPDILLEKPSGVRVEYNKDKNEVNVVWTKINKSSLTGYAVFRSSDPNDPLPEPISGMITENSFADKAVQVGRWFYTIKAFDEAGNISTSDAAELLIQ